MSRYYGWLRSQDGAFRITPSHLQKINGDPVAAKFPDAAGGGYLGFMEVLHQLHCVVRSVRWNLQEGVLLMTEDEQNSLWQLLYKDYYSNRSEIFKDSEVVLMEHLSIIFQLCTFCLPLLSQSIKLTCVFWRSLCWPASAKIDVWCGRGSHPHVLGQETQPSVSRL